MLHGVAIKWSEVTVYQGILHRNVSVDVPKFLYISVPVFTSEETKLIKLSIRQAESWEGSDRFETTLIFKFHFRTYVVGGKSI